MPIKLFVTGGTIDARYNFLTSKVDYKETHVHDMLRQARCRVEIAIEQLMLVDSNDMTAEQRQSTLEACRNAKEEKILISHGTDTMVETARLLGQNIHDKTVVLFGAMVPYAFGGSDALFNFGAALTAVQTLNKGVYITMNGKVFDWDKVTKNKELGEFQPAE
jgi:L-asparaginase